MRSDMIKVGVDKAPARGLLYATGQVKSSKDMQKPFIAICNSYIDIVPGHVQMCIRDRVWTVLTHAIESYVSVMASDYTRGLSLQAIKLVFENLEHSYHFGDEESREKMHNASTMAGMAFANAFPWYQPLTSSQGRSYV